MEKFHKLLKKKMDEGKELSPVDKEAKMGVLKDLHKMASDSMSDKLHGLKKVTVAAPDEKGLEHGLDKAKQIVNDMPEMLDKAESGHEGLEDSEEEHHEDLDDDNEEGEDPEHQEAVLGEHDDESEESIDAQLADLMKKKQLLQMKKA